MRRKVIAAFLGGLAFAAARPASGGWREQLPAGWTIESSVEGDLNGDGRDDVAATLSQTGADGVRKDVRVVVLLKKTDGTYALHTDSPKAACAGCGALAGTDGVEGRVGVRKGALVLSYRAGTHGQWKVTTRWRLKHGRFMMDGFTRVNEAGGEPGELLSAEASAAKGRIVERLAGAGGRSTTRSCRAPARLRETTLTGFDFANAEPWPSCGPAAK